MATCFSCGTNLDVDRVYRTTVCPSCGKEVKTCRNCKFYEPGAQWDCRETISEPIRDKERVNYCDYFQLSQNDTVSNSKKADTARTELDKLFGE